MEIEKLISEIQSKHVEVFNSFDLVTYNGCDLEEETRCVSLFSAIETLKAIIKYRDLDIQTIESALELIKDNEDYSTPISFTKERNVTDDYKFCNHYHELNEDYSLVNFGTGEFVANNEAIPLLKALNEVGLITRTHHYDGGEFGFVSIILDNVDLEIVNVNEIHAERTQFNGKKELLIRWKLNV